MTEQAQMVQVLQSLCDENRLSREAYHATREEDRAQRLVDREKDRVQRLADREEERAQRLADREEDRAQHLADREEDRAQRLVDWAVRDKHHAETLALLRVHTRPSASLTEFQPGPPSPQGQAGGGAVGGGSSLSSGSGGRKSASVKQQENVARSAFASVAGATPSFNSTTLPKSAVDFAPSSVFAHRIFTQSPFSTVNMSDFDGGFIRREENGAITLLPDPSGQHGVSFFLVTSTDPTVLQAVHDCRKVGPAGCTCFPLNSIPPTLSLVVNKVQLSAQNGAAITLHASLGPKEAMDLDRFRDALASWHGATPCGIFGAADVEEAWGTGSESSWESCSEDEEATGECEGEGETTPPARVKTTPIPEGSNSMPTGGSPGTPNSPPPTTITS